MVEAGGVALNNLHLWLGCSSLAGFFNGLARELCVGKEEKVEVTFPCKMP